MDDRGFAFFQFFFGLHTLQRGFVNYWVEILGVFASTCSELLCVPNLQVEERVGFGLFAHFAARFCELLGRDTRCVCVHLQ